MKKGTEITCVGLTILDILGLPIEEIPEPGKTSLIQKIRLTPAGTAAGPAIVAAKLGIPTSLIGAVGNDDMGDLLISMLKKQRVDTSHIMRTDALPTSATILAVHENGDRPNFHAPGASLILEINEAARKFIVNSRFVHWGGVGTLLKLDSGPGPEILKEARANGAVISCDFIAPMEQTLNHVKAVLPYVDYFMPSLEEAMEISGTKTPEDTAKFFLDCGAGTCILKWGAKGSLLTAGDKPVRIPAYKVDVVDTTGCGDSYCAGFLAALSKGWDVEKACRFGTATSALVATGLGTDAGVVNFEETEKAMNSLPVLE